jgi:hypothetical protein
MIFFGKEESIRLTASQTYYYVLFGTFKPLLIQNK